MLSKEIYTRSVTEGCLKTHLPLPPSLPGKPTRLPCPFSRSGLSAPSDPSIFLQYIQRPLRSVAFLYLGWVSGHRLKSSFKTF